MVTAKRARPCCGCKKPVTDPYKEFGLVYWCKECWEKWIGQVDKLTGCPRDLVGGESIVPSERSKPLPALQQTSAQIVVGDPKKGKTISIDALVAQAKANGRDIYAEMAVVLYGDVTPSTRRACKNMIYTAVYGYGNPKGTE